MWTVYIVRCADSTLYCGITNDLTARLTAHSTGKGAKYTRRRGPVKLAFAQKCRTKQLALRIEYKLKQLTRDQKQALLVEPARVVPIVSRARRELRAALA